jgi:manganese/zinc/iron transport system substrate-binding protein
MKKSSLTFHLLLLVALLGCQPEGPSPSPDGAAPNVLATTGMVADLAREVLGEAADVEALMAPGVDPHLYKARESDVRRLASADLVLMNGLHLEAKMGEVLEKIGRNRPVVAIAESLEENRLIVVDEGSGTHDPHVWFDVSLWADTVPTVADALVGVLPDREEGLRARAEDLGDRLRELDAWVADQIETIPAERRVLVTAHDAFGYFGRRYGMEVVGIQGISTASEAGVRDVERVVELVSSRDIPAIFVESSVPRRTVEAVVSGCAARGHDVAIGGELFSDSMGAKGTPEARYEGMVRHNVRTIVEALR